MDDKQYLTELMEATINMPSNIEQKYKTKFRSYLKPADSQHNTAMDQCRKKFKDGPQKHKCFIQVSSKYIQMIKSLKGKHSTECNKATDKAACVNAIKLVFDSEARDVLDSIKSWKDV